MCACLFLAQESGEDAYRLKLKSRQGPINVLVVQDDDSSPPPAKQSHLDTSTTSTQSETTMTTSSSCAEKHNQQTVPPSASKEKLEEDTSSLQAVSEEPIPDQSGDEEKMETSELEIVITEGSYIVQYLSSLSCANTGDECDTSAVKEIIASHGKLHYPRLTSLLPFFLFQAVPQYCPYLLYQLTQTMCSI